MSDTHVAIGIVKSVKAEVTTEFDGKTYMKRQVFFDDVDTEHDCISHKHFAKSSLGEAGGVSYNRLETLVGQVVVFHLDQYQDGRAWTVKLIEPFKDSPFYKALASKVKA